MKRSEVIKTIKRMGLRVSIHPSFDMEDWAQTLLIELENLGMIPNTFIESSVGDVYKVSELVDYANIDGRFDYEEEYEA